MASRHTGTVRVTGLGGDRSYAGIRGNYRLPRDVDRELATQPSPAEILAPLHERIAEQHPALVAAYRAIPQGDSGMAALRALDAWRREHHAAIQEAKSWPE